MEQEILHILQEINPYMEIETDTKLLEEEILDSMEILLLISELEDKYQIQIPLESLQLEDFQDIDRQMKKGETLALSDEQAYHYIHDRYGVGDEKNTSRMKRQQQYMEAFFTKAKEKAKSDKAYVSQLFRKFEQTATTNLTVKKISGLTNRLIKGTQKGFFEIQGTSKIGKALGDGIDHAEFYPDKESIVDVMTKIYGLKKRE